MKDHHVAGRDTWSRMFDDEDYLLTPASGHLCPFFLAGRGVCFIHIYSFLFSFNFYNCKPGRVG